jgi:CheY-like chemotaxis protein
VDDDVDSVLLVGNIFSHLGCETVYSLNAIEARKQICAGQSDIIILDWCLDRQIEAASVIDQCSRIFAKYGETGHRPRVVTYSSLMASEIELTANPYFEYFGHWQKPIGRDELLVQALSLLEKAEH